MRLTSAASCSFIFGRDGAKHRFTAESILQGNRFPLAVGKLCTVGSASSLSASEISGCVEIVVRVMVSAMTRCVLIPPIDPSKTRFAEKCGPEGANPEGEMR
jgi:hypothetical protein